MTITNAKDFMEVLDVLKADYADREIQESCALMDTIHGTGGMASIYRIKSLKALYEIDLSILPIHPMDLP
jgi:hypothetical protein